MTEKIEQKIEAFWVNATADDVARVMAGEEVETRFRDDEHSEYTAGLLAGWTKGDPSWMSREQAGSQSYFVTCQVYREPSWWTNKPDPGPGYRLLGKFPDELKLATDEYWSGEGWMPVGSRDNDQLEQVWYRRRIEPVEPEPKHYVLRVGDTAKLPNGQTITITEKGFEVTE